MTNAHLALNAIRQALSASDHEAGRIWLDRIREARSEAPLAFKRWLADKPTVELLQVTASDDGRILGAWIPGRRTVAIRSTYATFDGSIRDFAGHTHLFHSGDVFIALSDAYSCRMQISVYAA